MDPTASPAPNTVHQHTISTPVNSPLMTPSYYSSPTTRVLRNLASQRTFKRLRLYRKAKSLSREEITSGIKRKNLSRTFRDLAGYSAGAVILFLLYYNIQLIYPYLQAFFWAIICTFCLSYLKDVLVDVVDKLDEIFRPIRGRVLSVIVVFIAVGLVVARGDSLMLFTLFLIIALVISVISFDRHTLVSLVLIIAFLLLITFPLFYVLKTCFDESRELTLRVSAFLEHNEQFQRLLSDYEKSEVYLWAKNYAASWGYDVKDLHLDSLRAYIVDAIKLIGSNVTVFFGGAVAIAGSVGSIVVSIGIFISCLFYFLVVWKTKPKKLSEQGLVRAYFLLQSKDELQHQISMLSPFDQADNLKIVSSIQRSINRIFVCSLLLGVLHGMITFISFWWVKFELMVIFSVLSGFLSILPVLSSWLVWVPACVVLYLQGRITDALTVGVVHFLATYWLDPIIYSFIPGANAYFMGLSIVMGISQFGVIGVLLGPLAVGMFITMKDIYLSYLQDHNHHHDDAGLLNLDGSDLTDFPGMDYFGDEYYQREKQAE